MKKKRKKNKLLRLILLMFLISNTAFASGAGNQSVFDTALTAGLMAINMGIVVGIIKLIGWLFRKATGSGKDMKTRKQKRKDQKLHLSEIVGMIGSNFRIAAKG